MPRVLLLVGLASSACSGDAVIDRGTDSGQAEDAGEDAGTADALACMPGDEQECELGRPCPGVAACLAGGAGFGICGCVSCEVALEAGTCAWSLSALGGGSVNPAFLSLELSSGGVIEDVFPVTSASDCGASGGWYVGAGVTLELCPATCSAVMGGAEPSLTLGCASDGARERWMRPS